ncbi:Ti type entry exclusion protein TrbK [Rhizobium sp. PP-WC-1G-195]|nr:Ti type entry exclusion protein TrbK [Rhizobium sp. PP-WC-1G-195]
MSRPAILIIALLVMAVGASVTTLLVVRATQPENTQLSDEQQLTRQKVLGFSNELPPIEKGQEMRPRW